MISRPRSALLGQLPSFHHGHADEDKIVDLRGAAQYLKCSPRAFEKWIFDQRFCACDGLRRVGDLVRVHMPTLRSRMEAGSSWILGLELTKFRETVTNGSRS
jgi:hypothetical protein